MNAREPRPQREIQWIDGLRGITSLLVVFYHCRLAFGDPPYVSPLPIFRLITGGGHLSVATFFISSGYVCSLKPLKLALAGKVGDANVAVGSSAFRRFFRLYAPAAIITTVEWFLCQMGAFNLSRTLPGWLSDNSPPMTPDLLTSLKSLFYCWLETWRYGGDLWNTARNNYDPVQWTLAYEIRGSTLVYFMLVVTSSFTPVARSMVFLALIAFSVYSGDFYCALHFYTGTILALSTLVNVNVIPLSQSWKKLKRWLPVTLGILALVFASYPDDGTESKAVWSRFLLRLGGLIFPSDCIFPLLSSKRLGLIFRGYGFLSSCLLIVSIILSPTLQRLLSHRCIVFLGSISFPIYLLHCTLLRTLLVWLVYQGVPSLSFQKAPKVGENNEQSTETITNSPAMLQALAFCLWMALLIQFSKIWRDRVDKHCVVFSKWVEQKMTDEEAFSTVVRTIGHSLSVALESLRFVARNGWKDIQIRGYGRDA